MSNIVSLEWWRKKKNEKSFDSGRTPAYPASPVRVDWENDTIHFDQSLVSGNPTGTRRLIYYVFGSPPRLRKIEEQETE